MEPIRTQCVISGGGPAGIMLGYLLARAGIDVTVLEMWPDFFRDFRGDTIHPSTMQLLRELGLLDAFLKLPHDETKHVGVHIGGEEAIVADFTHLKTGMPFLAFIPQWDFLNFITAKARAYPSFHLLMETEATDVIKKDGTVIGVTAKNKSGVFEIYADLTVGADGRHSMVRTKNAFAVKDLGAPIDVLWFKIPRMEDGTATSLGYVDHGKIAILINRTTYWQVGYILRKGSFNALKARGIESFCADLARLVPPIATTVKELKDWDQIKLLSVAVDHLAQWYAPGVICIGDAAHAMSPVGGVGINLAIQDAVAAANILIPAFKRAGGVRVSDLKKIQKRRSWPARIIQNAQVFIHTRILEAVLSRTEHFHLPWQIRVIKKIPYLQRIPARLIGVGIRPEHVRAQ